VDSGHPDLFATYPNAYSHPSVKLTSLPHIGRSLQTLRSSERISSVHRGLSSRESDSRSRDSRILDPRFPDAVISRHVASVNRTAQIYSGVSTMENPELLSTGIPIPRFPISRNGRSLRHVASVNRTAQIYSGVSTMENPEPLSTGIPIPRFPISRNGRSHDTWPPSIGRLRSTPGVSTMENPELLSTGIPIPRFPISRNGRSHDTWPPSIGRLRSTRGFHHGKSQTLVNRNPDSAIPDFPKWEISRHVASVNRTAQIYSRVFTPIHWSLNPRVTPDRSNGCRVFQPRSDGSYWFLPMHSSTTPWTWKRSTVQILS
jgi:hypothetical protein